MLEDIIMNYDKVQAALQADNKAYPMTKLSLGGDIGTPETLWVHTLPEGAMLANTPLDMRYHYRDVVNHNNPPTVLHRLYHARVEFMWAPDPDEAKDLILRKEIVDKALTLAVNRWDVSPSFFMPGRGHVMVRDEATAEKLVEILHGIECIRSTARPSARADGVVEFLDIKEKAR